MSRGSVNAAQNVISKQVTQLNIGDLCIAPTCHTLRQPVCRL